jgi:hypothetical protein
MERFHFIIPITSHVRAHDGRDNTNLILLPSNVVKIFIFYGYDGVLQNDPVSLGPIPIFPIDLNYLYYAHMISVYFLWTVTMFSGEPICTKIINSKMKVYWIS